MAKPDIGVGYNALLLREQLKCEPDRTSSFISRRVKVLERTYHADGSVVARYPPRYGFEPAFARELEFSFKHEGVNLQILAALFEKVGGAEVQAWLEREPSSQYARLAGFLYEWLTGQALSYTFRRGARTVPVLDRARYYAPKGRRDPRWGVIDNLPGSRDFCPLVRRTDRMEAYVARDLARHVRETVAAIDPRMFERAVNYLYFAETRSSFALEREVPDSQRAERFRRLLEQAGAEVPLSEDTFLDWQRAILPAERAEASYRRAQNWLSRPGRFGAGSLADYIPPAPRDVEPMMKGIAKAAALVRDDEYPPVLAAACAAFGFVFVHPFLDGNGRLHRFLLHHLLRQGGVTPPNLVMPVSAAMLRASERYLALLRGYSRPRLERLDYRLDADAGFIHVRGLQPRWLYAFFDATALVEFVYECLERAIDVDLAQELEYLRGYDAAFERLSGWLEAPQPELERLIRFIVQNGGKLSKGKRGQFPALSDADIERAESIVSAAYADYLARGAPAPE
jgi:hypothetical protein